MDSVTQLALMSKAKKVFEREGTFLSFPVTPLAYKKGDFELFLQDTAHDLLRSEANLEAFSTLVNLIPTDEAWLPIDARFLWNEIQYVLKEGILASSTRTPEEERSYQKALAYLKVPGEGGLLQDSPYVQAYNQCKDAYILAEQEFMEARSTGEAIKDDAEKNQWQEVDEPAFRAKLKELDDQWIFEGYKNEVNIARSQYANLGAKSPVTTWKEWNERCNPDLDSRTNPHTGFTIFPTTFAPSNALEEGAWKPFSLNEGEIKTLINEAPADLRRRFSAEGIVSSVKGMTLEFSSATIKRFWFDSEVFRSRFWKLPNTTKVLSDGNTPPSGDCPAYVTAIVFARKVVVERSTQHAPSNQPISADLGFNYAVRDQRAITRINTNLMHAVQPHVLKPPPVHPQDMAIHPLPTPMRIRSQAMASSEPASMRRPAQPMRGPVMVEPGVGTPMVARPIYSRAMLNLQESTFTRLPTTPVKKPVPSPSGLPSASPTVPDNNIYVLAFICKPLPKCPDPDPTLQW